MNPLTDFIKHRWDYGGDKYAHTRIRKGKDYSKDNNPNLTYITNEKGNVIKVLRNRRTK